MTGRRERMHQFGADLVTTLAYAGSDGDNEVRRPRTKLAVEPPDGGRSGARRRAAPSCVHGGNGAGA